MSKITMTWTVSIASSPLFHKSDREFVRFATLAVAGPDLTLTRR